MKPQYLNFKAVSSKRRSKKEAQNTHWKAAEVNDSNFLVYKLDVRFAQFTNEKNSD